MDPRAEPLLTHKNGGVISSQKEENQPVTLQPSWEANNYPEDELNFKNLTMDEASLEVNEPKDKFYLVYITFLLHGIGVLMPWNMFITAETYFTEYKFGEAYVGEKLSYAASYLQYVTFAAQVPNVLFNWLNIYVQMGGDFTTRIVWSLGLQVILFVITIVLAMTDSREWPGAFFWITMISVVLINICTGIYQNTIFGMAAKFPFKFTAAVILGNNICGTFVTVVFIISSVLTDNQRLTATYYFITALFILLVCFDTYFALPINRFYRHHELKQKKEAERKSIGSGPNIRPPYWEIFIRALPQLYNVFFTFFVTLAVFPAVHANIKSNYEDFVVPSKYYAAVTCFLTFNVTAMIGSMLPSFFVWPKPKYLWIPITLRVFYIPFYLMCNYRVAGERSWPVLFGDEVYWIVAVTMGLTSGYFSSIAMIYTSTTAKPEHAGIAGQYGGAFLITGIFSGVLVSFIWPVLVV